MNESKGDTKEILHTTSPIPVRLYMMQELITRLVEATCGYVPPSRSLHHHLAFPLTKNVGEVRLVVFGDNVIEPRLPTELVHALRDFIPSSIPESREQRQKLAGKRRSCIVPEDNRRQGLE